MLLETVILIIFGVIAFIVINALLAKLVALIVLAVIGFVIYKRRSAPKESPNGRIVDPIGPSNVSIPEPGLKPAEQSVTDNIPPQVFAPASIQSQFSVSPASLPLSPASPPVSL